MGRSLFFSAMMLGGSWCLAAGCGSDATTAGSITSSGNQGSGGEAGGVPLASNLGFGASGQGGQGQGGSCAGEKLSAEPVPLDMYIMLDSSGSMDGTTGGSQTKWDAVEQALASFFADGASKGMGVGLQFFPLAGPTLPASCTNDSECGLNGPCGVRLCDQNGHGLCESDNDCQGNSKCVVTGTCRRNNTYTCWPPGSSCGAALGACDAPAQLSCSSPDSCDSADYAKPAQPIATLPGAATALNATIAAQSPGGLTPTSAALAGAVEYATSWRSSHPTHRVVVVLASDGHPTECVPTDADDIAQIAASAQSASASVATFAIGVLAPGDTEGRTKLNKIAAAGGTNKAFFVDPNGNVEAAFSSALASIRGVALACEYVIPQPTSGQSIDFGKVNVEYQGSGSGSPSTIAYVGNAAGCDAATGGWHYDVDPAQGVPTKILICDATCGVFGSGGAVDIRVGCETVLATPK